MRTRSVRGIEAARNVSLPFIVRSVSYEICGTECTIAAKRSSPPKNANFDRAPERILMDRSISCSLLNASLRPASFDAIPMTLFPSIESGGAGSVIRGQRKAAVFCRSGVGRGCARDVDRDYDNWRSRGLGFIAAAPKRSLCSAVYPWAKYGRSHEHRSKQ